MRSAKVEQRKYMSPSPDTRKPFLAVSKERIQDQENTTNPFEKLHLQNSLFDYSQTFDKSLAFGQTAENVPVQQESIDSNSKLGFDESSKKKSRRNPWNLKGLSGQVKELMLKQQESTYKQIANTLVQKLSVENINLSKEEQNRENQNLKRRVYDSINVMVALGVLNKKGKTISIGNMDQNMDNIDSQHVGEVYKQIEEEVYEKRSQMGVKRKFFREQTNKVISLKALISRNQDQEKLNENQFKFFFPLILSQTKLEASKHPVLLQMNHGQTELRVLSKNEITIFGDLDILAKLKKLDLQSSIPLQDLLINKNS